jgi:hypothetical protein
MARSRVHDDPGRLVDDEEVLVLVRDPQVELLGLQLGALLSRELDLERLATREAVALGRGRPVDPNRAGLDQPLGRAAGRDLGQPREETVEPLARGLVRNARPERL